MGILKIPEEFHFLVQQFFPAIVREYFFSSGKKIWKINIKIWKITKKINLQNLKCKFFMLYIR